MHNQVLQFPGVTKDKVARDVRQARHVTTEHGHDLATLMPALLEALGTGGTAVIVVADNGTELVRWYANKPARRDPRLHPRRGPRAARDPDARPGAAPVDRAAHRADPRRPGDARRDRVHAAPQGRHATSPIEATLGRQEVGDAIVYVIVIRSADGHQQQLSLLEADRIGLVGALAAGFAHEINNPLTSVLLNLRSLRKQLSAMPEQRPVAGAAVPRRHHGRRRADREQRPRAPDARHPQRDPADRSRRGGVVGAAPGRPDPRAARPRDPATSSRCARSPARSRGSARPCSR